MISTVVSWAGASAAKPDRRQGILLRSGGTANGGVPMHSNLPESAQRGSSRSGRAPPVKIPKSLPRSTESCFPGLIIGMLPASKITFPVRRTRNTGTSPNNGRSGKNGTGGGALNLGARHRRPAIGPPLGGVS
ncbi:hypothetical protein Ari01nite_93850 [Paractinoplanes rishiriensis]|uniref:Uncharacterized protein n=1 Tax=Paractinoplanes rishiriensis TaxID=1050105 RepID=A0A919KAJ7_9ACTN|nr:hypothetical protein Ari01nite_93850 [Actinoplanes rishiriensis]